MLRKTTRRPSAKLGPGCQVACFGTLKSKYLRPVPSALTSAVLPCEVKNNRPVRSGPARLPALRPALREPETIASASTVRATTACDQTRLTCEHSASAL